ncbi:SHOCT domain-containing protein [Tahibacter caeni]|uniref:SHOCT domain-containing protein n=1 Tax=Tahibacter caeni TaxID=1453545 RepID=UPI0021494452|nr:SHOCT domain-containing protein [Tahibacter caeni]
MSSPSPNPGNFPWKTLLTFGGAIAGFLAAIAQRPRMFGTYLPLAEYLHYNGGEVVFATTACAIGGLLLGALISTLVTHGAASPPPPRVAAPPPAPAHDRVDRLRQLKELLDSGALNEQEFAAEKARILSKSP